MSNVFGITNLQIKTFDCFQDELTEVNEFLKEHNGDVVNIQTEAMLYGKTRYIITYREKPRAKRECIEKDRKNISIFNYIGEVNGKEVVLLENFRYAVCDCIDYTLEGGDVLTNVTYCDTLEDLAELIMEIR